MPLYRCTQCDVIENTALGDYWQQQLEAEERSEPFKPKCSQCLTGQWHGKFAREGIGPDWLQDGKGFLWRKTEIESVAHLGPFKPVELGG